MHRSIKDHFTEYRRDGYTVFQNFMSPDRLQHICQTVDAEFRRRLAGADATARMKGFERANRRQDNGKAQLAAQ